MGIINQFSDKQFSEIIKNSKTWKEIGEKLGYKNAISSYIKQKIIDRCSKLDIVFPIIKKSNPVEKQTKGQLFKSRKNWQSARTAIRKSAQKSFEDSGKPYKCVICGYTNHIEIAHIKAVSDFDDNILISEINNPDNLIGLCPNHHWEYDNGLLKI